MKEKLLGFLIYCLYRLIGCTYRYTYIDDHHYQAAKDHHSSKSYIFAIWHQNIFASIYSKISIPHITMASMSKDGEIIAQLLKIMGYTPARGSSSRGGRRALDEMIDYINNKDSTIPAALTIDGPRGPAHVVKKGIFDLALATKQAILPYTVYPDKFWSLKSWDQFRIPKPFSKIVAIYGTPIVVQGGSEIDYPNYQAQLKNSLEEMELRAQKYFNHIKKKEQT